MTPKVSESHDTRTEGSTRAEKYLHRAGRFFSILALAGFAGLLVTSAFLPTGHTRTAPLGLTRDASGAVVALTPPGCGQIESIEVIDGRGTWRSEWEGKLERPTSFVVGRVPAGFTGVDRPLIEGYKVYIGAETSLGGWRGRTGGFEPSQVPTDGRVVVPGGLIEASEFDGSVWCAQWQRSHQVMAVSSAFFLAFAIGLLGYLVLGAAWLIQRLLLKMR